METNKGNYIKSVYPELRNAFFCYKAMCFRFYQKKGFNCFVRRGILYFVPLTSLFIFCLFIEVEEIPFIQQYYGINKKNAVFH